MSVHPAIYDLALMAVRAADFNLRYGKSYTATDGTRITRLNQFVDAAQAGKIRPHTVHIMNVISTRGKTMVAQRGSCLNEELTIGLSQMRRVVYIGYGKPPDGSEAHKRSNIYVAGKTAELLYMAITGHDYDQGPCAACPRHAEAARHKLLTRENTTENKMALRAMTYFDDTIWPGLGQSQLDSCGHPMANYRASFEKIR